MSGAAPTSQKTDVDRVEAHVRLLRRAQYFASCRVGGGQRAKAPGSGRTAAMSSRQSPKATQTPARAVVRRAARFDPGISWGRCTYRGPRLRLRPDLTRKLAGSCNWNSRGDRACQAARWALEARRRWSSRTVQLVVPLGIRLATTIRSRPMDVCRSCRHDDGVVHARL
jgi:hypothetical protein